MRGVYVFLFIAMEHINSRFEKLSVFKKLKQQQQQQVKPLIQSSGLSGIQPGGLNNVIFEILDDYFIESAKNSAFGFSLEKVIALKANYFLDVKDKLIEDHTIAGPQIDGVFTVIAER